MSILTRSNFVRRSLVLAAVCGASVAAMSAQSTQPAAVQTVTAPQVNFKMLALDPALDTSSSSSSSSTTDDVASVGTVDPLHLNAMQYNGRRRYGRPRYRGGNTNPDGSSKYIFYGGVGLSQPIGNTWKYFTPSWGIQIGGGRQFNSHVAVPVEFDYDRFGLTKQTMANQSFIYTGDFNAADNGIDANMHTWSFSVDPTYTFFNGATGDGLGAYVVADVGFYHKVTSFTAPQEAEYCSPYYGCGIYELNSNFDHYTSNAPGFGGGIGFTYKISHFSSERLYAEARYVFVDNSQRAGYTVTEAENGVPYGGSNFFPANTNRTTFIPVKFGVRF